MFETLIVYLCIVGAEPCAPLAFPQGPTPACTAVSRERGLAVLDEFRREHPGIEARLSGTLCTTRGIER